MCPAYSPHSCCLWKLTYVALIALILLDGSSFGKNHFYYLLLWLVKTLESADFSLNFVDVCGLVLNVVVYGFQQYDKKRLIPKPGPGH